MNTHKTTKSSHKLTGIFSAAIATAAAVLVTGCTAEEPISINQNFTEIATQISNANTTETSDAGTTQENPILPTGIRNGAFSFTNVQSGRWYDPPTAYGFRYTMTSGSLFTDILDFPTGFSTPFTVAVKDVLIGNFTAGQSVKFKDYRTQLGSLLVQDVGVSEFSVTGLNIEPANPKLFPLKLAFNTETASFDQEIIEQVPEPLTFCGGVLGFGAMVAARKRRRIVKQQ